jgi:hypothetical protein
MTCRGGPEYVIANGRVTVDEGQVKAVQGYGSFIPTPAFAPFVYDAVAEREKVIFFLSDFNFKKEICLIDGLVFSDRFIN